MVEIQVIDLQDNWENQVTQAQVDQNWKPTKPQGALARNPISEDLQSPLGFRFFLRGSPTTNYFVKRINIPAIQLPPAIEATPYIGIPVPGDHPQFDPLVLTFQVNEGMDNYFELQDWLKAVAGFNPKEYGKLDKVPEFTGYGLESEILVSVLDASKNAIRNITFHNAWPTSLTGLQYDASLGTVDYLVATATFYFLDYTSTRKV